MVPLIITLLQWEFVVSTMVIFFNAHNIQAARQGETFLNFVGHKLLNFCGQLVLNSF